MLFTQRPLSTCGFDCGALLRIQHALKQLALAARTVRTVVALPDTIWSDLAII